MLGVNLPSSFLRGSPFPSPSFSPLPTSLPRFAFADAFLLPFIPSSPSQIPNPKHLTEKERKIVKNQIHQEFKNNDEQEVTRKREEGIKEEEMDERGVEDEDAADTVTKMATTGHPPQRKGIRYSQPLGKDAAVASSARRNALPLCNHSLENHHPSNPFLDSAPDPLRSFSCPHYHLHSSPPPSLPHHHHSNSVDDVRFAPHHSHHPPLPPSHHHQHGLVTAGGSFSNPFGSGGGSSLSGSDGSLTLERAMSEYGGAPGTLPEFMGGGGGTGIFRVPLRAAMHPGRPPALELRPHPLRETQAGSFLRTIVCARGQLWAGSESGLRVWRLENVFDGWDAARPARKGDEESAPFRESCHSSPTMCLAVVAATGLIWSGHKDG